MISHCLADSILVPVNHMNREEALSLLNTKLDEYRNLSYDELAARVGDEEFPEMVGASGAQYQIEIQIVWDDKPSSIQCFAMPPSPGAPHS